MNIHHKNTGLDNQIVESALGKSMGNSPNRRTIVIDGEPQFLDIIEQMLGYISYLGKVGHSTNFIVGVDGDGSARITSKRDGKDLYKVHKKAMEEQIDEVSGDIKRFDLA